MSGQQLRQMAELYHERGNRYQRAGQNAEAQLHWDAASFLIDAAHGMIQADAAAQASGLTFSGIGVAG